MLTSLPVSPLLVEVSPPDFPDTRIPSLIAIAVIGIALVTGFRAGFRRQIPSLVGLLFGIVCAHIFRIPAHDAAVGLFPHFAGRTETEFIYGIIGSGSVFTVAYFIFKSVLSLFSPVFRRGGGSVPDGMAGGLLRLFVCSVFLSLIFNLSVCVSPRSRLTESLRHSDANIVSQVLLIAPDLLGTQTPEELVHLQQLEDAGKIS